MKIINTANGRETTLGSAVSIVTDDDGTGSNALRDMVVRLLEELTFTADDSPPILRAQQLSRILAYKFEVRED